MTINQLPILRPGESMGVGSLPHRDVIVAAEFAWSATTIPTMPTLPRRSPAEAMIAQALVGIEGVTVGQYGGISVDVAMLKKDSVIVTDITDDAFVGYRAFLDVAGARRNSQLIKWQFVGPVTLGMTLVRTGVPTVIAFDLALRAVRSHIQALENIVAAVLPASTQLIMVDEPLLTEALAGESDVSPDAIVDLVSGALAAISPDNLNGIHCCADSEWTALFSMGAAVLSIPVPSGRAIADIEAVASRITEHLELGGIIAWGALRTDGPIPTAADRAWKSLTGMWCSLVRKGVDPILLRKQSIVTPVCGLGMHTDEIAIQVMGLVDEISLKVQEQATASRLTLGS